MGNLLGRVGVRVGIAAGLLLLVLGIVAVARVAGDGRNAGLFSAPPDYLPSSVDPTAGDDAEVVATPSVYADTPAVLTAARAFASAWLHRDLSPTAWHAGVAPHSTESLATSLEGVDPLSVPATRATGEFTLVRRTDRYAEVAIVVDTGTLELTLGKPDNRWLVDGVDWERA